MELATDEEKDGKSLFINDSTQLGMVWFSLARLESDLNGQFYRQRFVSFYSVPCRLPSHLPPRFPVRRLTTDGDWPLIVLLILNRDNDCEIYRTASRTLFHSALGIKFEVLSVICCRFRYSVPCLSCRTVECLQLYVLLADWFC